MVVLTRSAVSRAAALAYQHSRMILPITRNACQVEGDSSKFTLICKRLSIYFLSLSLSIANTHTHTHTHTHNTCNKTRSHTHTVLITLHSHTHTLSLTHT